MSESISPRCRRLRVRPPATRSAPSRSGRSGCDGFPPFAPKPSGFAAGARPKRRPQNRFMSDRAVIGFVGSAIHRANASRRPEPLSGSRSSSVPPTGSPVALRTPGLHRRPGGIEGPAGQKKTLRRVRVDGVRKPRLAGAVPGRFRGTGVVNAPGERPVPCGPASAGPGIRRRRGGASGRSIRACRAASGCSAEAARTATLIAGSTSNAAGPSSSRVTPLDSPRCTEPASDRSGPPGTRSPVPQPGPVPGGALPPADRPESRRPTPAPRPRRLRVPPCLRRGESFGPPPPAVTRRRRNPRRAPPTVAAVNDPRRGRGRRRPPRPRLPAAKPA